jgi:LCP family protein required for cell wall assembly
MQHADERAVAGPLTADESQRAPRRVWPWVAGALAIVVLVAAAGAAVVGGRAWTAVERVPLLPTADAASQERFVLIVGTDGRPAPDDPELGPSFGDARSVEGERADLAVVLRTGGDRPDELLVVPRDLVVEDASGDEGRLAVDWLDSPQAYVDALCVGTGLPVDHLIALAPATFVRTVDAIGGLQVDVVKRIRDPRAKLAPIGPGRVTLNGTEALAWVRSRNPEVFTGDGWAPIADPAQASLIRNDRSPAVLRAVGEQARLRPWTLARSSIASTIRVDDAMTWTTAASIARSVDDVQVVSLDVDQGRGRVPKARLTDQGQRQLAAFVGEQRCTPSPA